MIKAAFIIFELLTIGLFLACFWHAYKQKTEKVIELLFALFFGVFLEWMTIQQLAAYHYGDFFIMIDGAPICIGLGWAVIIYSGMEFVKLLNMPDFARPFLVGMLALNLDLAMDAIAIRLGFWNWVIPLDAQWFGVPWGNFWAWYIVVVSYSGFLYWFRYQLKQREVNWLRWSYPLLSFLGAVLVLAITNFVFVEVFAKTELVSAMSMMLIILMGAVIIYVVKPKFYDHAYVDKIIFLVPLTFHLFFTFFGFAAGFYSQLPILAVVGLSMFAVGMGVHLLPWYRRKVWPVPSLPL
ncbi:MAG TPA: carotenoid biosynthesis protein [Anaerolineaceae bacterium]|nr:carotenoid biosynthesis protein [Anaerolineaceae bacterium]